MPSESQFAVRLSSLRLWFARGQDPRNRLFAKSFHCWGFDHIELRRQAARLIPGQDLDKLVQELLEVEHFAFDLLVAASDLAASLGKGRVDLGGFHGDLQEPLRRQYPWLSDSSVTRLKSYADWMAWHEGL